MEMRDIDFLIIGATKSATTWLQQSLQQDPGIFMPDRNCTISAAITSAATNGIWNISRARSTGGCVAKNPTPTWMCRKRQKE